MPLDVETRKLIERRIQRAEEGYLVSETAALLRDLEEKNLVYRSQIQPRFVRIHPLNRDGMGCGGTDVRALLSDIVSVGFDWSQPQPVAVELQDPTEIAEVTAFNEKLVMLSGTDKHTSLAPVEPASVKFASLSSSHTNMALRLFAASMPHVGDEVLLVDGKLSLHQLRSHDANFAEAVERGLMWTIVSNAVVAAYPTLAHLLQQAFNTSSQLQRKEGELQLFRRLLKTWQMEASKTATATAISFHDVRGQILRSKPACAASVPFMWNFMLKFGGGSAGTDLLESESLVKSMASSQRILGPQFWDHLSQDVRGGEPLLRVRHAAFRLAYIADENTVVPSDVKRLFSQASLHLTLAAEKLMQEMRDLGRALPYEVWTEVLLFEHECIKVILDKKDRFKSLEHCAQACVMKVKEVDGRELTTKWISFQEDDGAPQESSGHEETVQNLVLSFHILNCFSLERNSESCEACIAMKLGHINHLKVRTQHLSSRCGSSHNAGHSPASWAHNARLLGKLNHSIPTCSNIFH